MSLLKCKCCGADLHVEEGKKIARCEYCGSEQTVPSTSDAGVLGIYARGNLLRSQGEFDKAYLVFSQLVSGESQDAEAYWSLLLCKYGVTYVDDYDGGKKPTINRMSMSSILDDEDYKKALSLADVVAKESYEREADRIAKIQQRILEIVQREKPYDVFISYKETDEVGGRTEDSVHAQDIYDRLTEQGYRVFLSRVTLSEVVGREYEPYIYSALYTAKAMILVSCDIEYVNAVWVRNEWSRYLLMMAKDKDKILIPCYKGVNPYDLPKELRNLQGIDMSKLGWIQDLSIGLKKVVKWEREKETSNQATVMPTGLDAMADQMIQRGFAFLKRGKKEQAEKMFDESATYADRAMSYIGHLCIRLNVNSPEELANIDRNIDLETLDEFENALIVASPEEKKTLDGILSRRREKEQKCIQELYDSANECKSKADYEKAISILSSITPYLDSEYLIGECERLRHEQIEEENRIQRERLAEERRIAEEKARIAEEKKNKEILDGFAKVRPSIEDVINLKKVDASNLAHAERTLRTYQKYKDIIEDYDSLFSQLNTKRLEYEKAKKKKTRVFAAIIGSVAILTTSAILLTNSLIIPLVRQNDIYACINEKKYEQAESLLDQNGTFGDADVQRKLISAGYSFSQGKYEEGIDYVLDAGGTVEVTYDGNGGTLKNKNQTIKRAHITNTSEKEGYDLSGWNLEDYQVKANERWFSISLSAKWQMITYTITYDLNGGTVSSNNPSSYNVLSDDIVLEAPTKDGYTFLGWYDENGTLFASIPTGSYGDLTLTAKWQANLNSLSVTSSDESKGRVAIVSGSGYTDEEITIKATPADDCLFKGWYCGDELVSSSAEYTFTMPSSDYSLVGRFWTKAEEEERRRSLGMTPVISDDGKSLTYGLYPQTHVSDAEITARLDALAAAESNGWYLLDGAYYAKETANPYNTWYTFDDGTTITEGTAYWFRCEPIKWNILSSSDGAYSLVSSVLLDAHRYDSSSNNYAKSEIRSWLNGDFYDSAFSLDDSYVQTVTVDNSAATTGSSTNTYACENTNDKVYLLSYKDYKNAEYFADDAARLCKPTDWAKANGAYVSDKGYGYYWSRSPYSNDSYCAWCVLDDGYLIYSGYVGYDDYCVRPSLQIKVS